MITNKALKQCSKQVFTYSAQYQAPFYGRERSIEEMREKVASLKKGEILFISQPLGTGKTFLVDHMIATSQIPVPRQTAFLMTKGIAENAGLMDSFPGDILVVDEADIKTSYKKLLIGIKNLRKYLDETKKKAILLGDFSLKGKELGEALGTSRMLLSFEPMDRAFLEGVLMSRFRAFMEDFLDVDFSLDSVIDPEIIRFLAPEWMKSSNSFRGIFSLMQEVVDNNNYVRYNNDKAYIDISMFRDYLAKEGSFVPYSDEQEEYFEVLKNFLRTEHPAGSGIGEGFNYDTLYGLAEGAGIDIEYDDFEEGIIDPFLTGGWLVATGIPATVDGRFVRRPAPYVPSLKLLLSSF